MCFLQGRENQIEDAQDAARGPYLRNTLLGKVLTRESEARGFWKRMGKAETCPFRVSN